MDDDEYDESLPRQERMRRLKKKLNRIRETIRSRPKVGDRVRHTVSPMTGVYLRDENEGYRQCWIRVFRDMGGNKMLVPYSMRVMRDELVRMSELEILADEYPDCAIDEPEFDK